MSMKAGVIGSGSMGAGIAQVVASAGYEVVLIDKQAEALKRAEEQLRSVMRRLAEKGKISAAEAAAIRSRITYALDLEALQPVSVVFEAVVESLEVKQQLFRALEDVVGPDCVLATNTSSLSVSAIASACSRNPGRALGIHFFNPAPLMQLVEVIPAVQTAPEIADQVLQLLKSWGKVPVLVKDTPGFIVNRVARPFYGEALRILEEGIADEATIDWAMTELGGFRMGPFELMDYIGHDINFTVTRSVYDATFNDPRYRPSLRQQRMMEAGFLGRKSGRGFYDYREGAERPSPKKDLRLGRAILDRILVMLVNEAADAVYWGIASREDVDLAMTLGVNYPKGLLRWADDLGIAWCVNQLDHLYEDYREDRYRCSPLLRKMSRDCRSFYRED